MASDSEAFTTSRAAYAASTSGAALALAWADAAAARDGGVRVLYRLRKLGLGTACAAPVRATQ